jgi:hypothetical protein
MCERQQTDLSCLLDIEREHWPMKQPPSCQIELPLARGIGRLIVRATVQANDA